MEEMEIEEVSGIAGQKRCRTSSPPAPGKKKARLSIPTPPPTGRRPRKSIQTQRKFDRAPLLTPAFPKGSQTRDKGEPDYMTLFWRNAWIRQMESELFSSEVPPGTSQGSKLTGSTSDRDTIDGNASAHEPAATSSPQDHKILGEVSEGETFSSQEDVVMHGNSSSDDLILDIEEVVVNRDSSSNHLILDDIEEDVVVNRDSSNHLILDGIEQGESSCEEDVVLHRDSSPTHLILDDIDVEGGRSTIEEDLVVNRDSSSDSSSNHLILDDIEEDPDVVVNHDSSSNHLVLDDFEEDVVVNRDSSPDHLILDDIKQGESSCEEDVLLHRDSSPTHLILDDIDAEGGRSIIEEDVVANRDSSPNHLILDDIEEDPDSSNHLILDDIEQGESSCEEDVVLHRDSSPTHLILDDIDAEGGRSIIEEDVVANRDSSPNHLILDDIEEGPFSCEEDVVANRSSSLNHLEDTEKGAFSCEEDVVVHSDSSPNQLILDDIEEGTFGSEDILNEIKGRIPVGADQSFLDDSAGVVASSPDCIILDDVDATEAYISDHKGDRQAIPCPPDLSIDHEGDFILRTDSLDSLGLILDDVDLLFDKNILDHVIEDEGDFILRTGPPISLDHILDDIDALNDNTAPVAFDESNKQGSTQMEPEDSLRHQEAPVSEDDIEMAPPSETDQLEEEEVAIQTILGSGELTDAESMEEEAEVARTISLAALLSDEEGVMVNMTSDGDLLHLNASLANILPDEQGEVVAARKFSNDIVVDDDNDHAGNIIFAEDEYNEGEVVGRSFSIDNVVDDDDEGDGNGVFADDEYDEGEVVARSFSVINVVDDDAEGESEGVYDDDEEEALTRRFSIEDIVDGEEEGSGVDAYVEAKGQRTRGGSIEAHNHNDLGMDTGFMMLDEEGDVVAGDARTTFGRRDPMALTLGRAYDSDNTVLTDHDAESEDEWVPPSPKYLVFSDTDSAASGREGQHEMANQSRLSVLSSTDHIPGVKDISDPTVKRLCRDLRARDTVRGRDLANVVEVIFTVQRSEPVQARLVPAVADQTLEETASARRRSERLSQRPPKPLKNVRQPRDRTKTMIQSMVRAHAFKLMKRKKAAAGKAAISTATVSRVTKFLTQPEYGPSAQYFHLFLDFDSLQSKQARQAANSWNRRAGEVFVECFLDEYPGEEDQADLIKSSFMTHIKQLRKDFETQLAHEEENEGQIAAMRKAAKEQLRRSRCQRRIDTLKSCDRDPAMRRLYQFAKSHLTWKCCSGESTDTQGENAITVLPWRARRIRSFMRTLDLLNLALRFPINQPRGVGRLPKGRYDPEAMNPPRNSVEETVHPECVPGLPANFYDSDWLQSLPRFEKDRVRPTSPINLAIPDYIIQEAEAAATVRSRKSKSRPRSRHLGTGNDA
ncbi:hypothetical protein MD484_g8069, partial [Candolleomyces efflorescens]